MKPVKVAYITSQIVGVPYTYCVIMKKLGIETVLYRRKIKNKGYGAESGNPQDVDVRYLNENPILRYIQIIKINNEYDILHLHDAGGKLEAIFCGFGKAKIIYHFHGSAIREGATNFTFLTLIKKMYWKHIGIYSKVLVSTEDLLPHWKGSELILDPIDRELLYVHRNQNTEQPYILSPHWCDDGVKGTFMVFTAWDLLKTKFTNFKLHVINWGKDAPYYKNQTKDDDTIVWHNLLSRPDFLKLMAGATVSWGEFIIPAYGLTEIEAFTIGVPDVSDPDITEVELAEYTEKLILDDNLRSAVIDKQKQIILKYDSDIISKRMFDIYMSVLA